VCIRVSSHNGGQSGCCADAAKPNSQLLEWQKSLLYIYCGCGRNSWLCRTCQAHCNTLQHTASQAHCNTLQHTATHCNTLQHTATHCNTLQHTATHCNTPKLQHTTARNTPQRGVPLCESDKRRRGERDAGVENKNTQNTQIDLNK